MPPPVILQGCLGPMVYLLLGLTLIPRVTPCTLPAYLRSVYGWSSQVRLWGNSIGRQHDFDEHHMNVSLHNQEPGLHYFTCHKAIGDDTFIFREITDDTPAYRCVRFERWSQYVVRIWESDSEPKSSRSLCEEDSLTVDQWPLVWPHFDLGYVPCPDIGGFDMDVLDSQGVSFCEYIQPVPKPRFESECIQGESMQFEFRLDICKRDIPLDRSATLYCLGHSEVGGYTHIVATDNKPWPKIMMLRYAKGNDSGEMHLFGDIVLETQKEISRKASHITLKKTLYDNLCVDNHPNCLAPETCHATNVINCQTTCQNYTTCLADKDPCLFDPATLGTWIETTYGLTRVLGINNVSANLASQGVFQCLNVYSSTTTGLKPIVKVMTNGCKPRFACLDLEAYSTSVLKYRLSKYKRWPYRDNILRGDLCGQTAFKDGPYPIGSRFQNEYSKILVRTHPPATNSKRSTVGCKLEGTIDFRMGANCSGTLRSCQSGHSMVMTFGRGCTYMTSSQRVFFNCLASFKTSVQMYIVTERSDDPNDLHCWVRRVDKSGLYPNVLVQLHASECSNGSLLSLTSDNGQHLMRVQYNSAGQDSSSDSCLDLPTPTPPTTTTSPSTVRLVSEKEDDATLAPTAYKNLINATEVTSPPEPMLTTSSSTLLQSTSVTSSGIVRSSSTESTSRIVTQTPSDAPPSTLARTESTHPSTTLSSASEATQTVGDISTSTTLQRKVTTATQTVGDIPTSTTLQRKVTTVTQTVGDIPTSTTLQRKVTTATQTVGDIPTSTTLQRKVTTVTQTVGDIATSTTLQRKDITDIPPKTKPTKAPDKEENTVNSFNAVPASVYASCGSAVHSSWFCLLTLISIMGCLVLYMYMRLD